jgi:hypothetical protein
MGAIIMALEGNKRLINRMGNAISIMLVAMLVMSSIPLSAEGRANEKKILQTTTPTPINGTTNVGVNEDYLLSFSEVMNNAIGSVNIWPTPPTAGTWIWSTNKMWLNNTGVIWQEFTTYYVNLTGFEDEWGFPLTGDMQFQFTTGDFTAPTVVLSDDHPDSIVRDADTVTITATFTEANGINETSVPTITIGSLITNVAMTKTTNLIWTYAWNVPAGNDGAVMVYIIATDVAGNPNTAATGQTSYTIDNIAPTVSTLVRSNPVTSTTNAGSVVWRVTFSEPVNSVGSNDFDFFVISGSITGYSITSVTPVSTSVYDIVVNTGSNSGELRLNVIASATLYDTATNQFGSTAYTSGQTYIIDKIAPTSNVNTITPYFYRTTPLSITVTSSDGAAPASGVAFVALYYRFSSPTNGTFGAWTLFNNDTVTPFGPWSFNWPSGQGYYEFYTRAGDLAGNYEAAPAVADDNAMYDTTGPTSNVNVITPYFYRTTPLSITVTSVDATPASGVAFVALYYRYAANNATWGAWTLFSNDTIAPFGPFSFTWPSGAGYYEFYTRAGDLIGN